MPTTSSTIKKLLRSFAPGYEALHREAQRADGFMPPKVPSYLTVHNPFLFKITMSCKLKGVLKRIGSLVKEMNEFGLVARAVAAPIVHPQTHSGLDDPMDDIYGRNADKELVVKLLLDQSHKMNTEVLPIVGMGGLGKTTLAKMVYNDGVVFGEGLLGISHFEKRVKEKEKKLSCGATSQSAGRCDKVLNLISLPKVGTGSGSAYLLPGSWLLGFRKEEMGSCAAHQARAGPGFSEPAVRRHRVGRTVSPHDKILVLPT